MEYVLIGTLLEMDFRSINHETVNPIQDIAIAQNLYQRRYALG